MGKLCMPPRLFLPFLKTSLAATELMISQESEKKDEVVKLKIHFVFSRSFECLMYPNGM